MPVCIILKSVLFSQTSNNLLVIGDRERCLQAGMDDHITKPLRRNDLLNAINKLATEKSTVARNLLLRRANSSNSWAGVAAIIT